MGRADRPGTQGGAASPPTSGKGRDGRGRFAAGNPGGVGNPFARQTAALRTALVSAVSEQDIAEVIQALLGKARQGDVAATKLLLAYTVGKPAVIENPDTLDRDELALLSGNSFEMEPVMRLASLLPAEAVLRFVHALLPIITEARAHQFRGVLQQVLQELDKRQGEKKEEAPEAAFQESAEPQEAAPAAGSGLETLHLRERERRALAKALGIGTVKKSARRKAGKKARKAERAERRRQKKAGIFGRSPSPVGSNGRMAPSAIGPNGDSNGKP